MSKAKPPVVLSIAPVQTGTPANSAPGAKIAPQGKPAAKPKLQANRIEAIKPKPKAKPAAKPGQRPKPEAAPAPAPAEAGIHSLVEKTAARIEHRAGLALQSTSQGIASVSYCCASTLQEYSSNGVMRWPSV